MIVSFFLLEFAADHILLFVVIGIVDILIPQFGIHVYLGIFSVRYANC